MKEGKEVHKWNWKRNIKEIKSQGRIFCILSQYVVIILKVYTHMYIREILRNFHLVPWSIQEILISGISIASEESMISSVSHPCTKSKTMLHNPHPQLSTKGEWNQHLGVQHWLAHYESSPQRNPWVLKTECMSFQSENAPMTPLQIIWAPKPDQNSLAAATQSDLWFPQPHTCVITGYRHNNDNFTKGKKTEKSYRINKVHVAIFTREMT